MAIRNPTDVSWPVTHFRSEFEDQTIRKEFDAQNAALTGFLSQEHRDDGTHSDITVDTITLRNQLVPYVTSWTGATTNPVLGNGSLISKYQRIGNQVTVLINLTAGSTTTFGTGQWAFSLPSRWLYWAPSMVLLLNVGVASYTGMTYAASLTTIGIANAGGTTPADVTTPFAWGTGDQVWFQFTYWE